MKYRKLAMHEYLETLGVRFRHILQDFGFGDLNFAMP